MPHLMNSELTAHKTSKIPTERPTATKDQLQARKENRAIFILKGRDYTHAFQGVLPSSYIKALMAMQKDCIDYIKSTQRVRAKQRKEEKANAKNKI